MPYLTDEPEGYYDDESIAVLGGAPRSAWSSFGAGEEVGPRYVRDHRRDGGQRTPYTPYAPPPPAPRPVSGLTGATINTPAGAAQMRFERPVATKEAVEAVVSDLRREVAAVLASVRTVDSTVDKNTSILDKKVATLEAMLKKAQQSAQMGLLLPLLINKPAALQQIKVQDAADTSATPPTKTFNVTETTFKAQDSTGLLVAMLAMSGGFGGSGGGMGGGDGDMSMLFLVLALSGGLGGSK